MPSLVFGEFNDVWMFFETEKNYSKNSTNRDENFLKACQMFFFVQKMSQNLAKDHIKRGRKLFAANCGQCHSVKNVSEIS